MTSDRAKSPGAPAPAFVAIVKSRHGSRGGVPFWFMGAGGRFDEDHDPKRWEEDAKPPPPEGEGEGRKRASGSTSKRASGSNGASGSAPDPTPVRAKRPALPGAR